MKQLYSLLVLFLFVSPLLMNAQIPCAGAPAVNTLVVSTNPVCSGSSVTLSLANANNFSGITYSWQASTFSSVGPWTNFSLTVLSNNTVLTAPITQNTWFTVIITCTNGGISTNAQPALVNVANNSITINSPTLCSGQSTTLNAISAGTINWYATATSSISLGTGSTLALPNLSAGNYTYFAEATNACTFAPFRFPTTVSVNASPTISCPSATLCNGQNTYTFFPSGAATYTNSAGVPIVSPTITTNYTVIGTSTNGCVSSTTVTITKLNITPPSVSINSGSICPGFSFVLSPVGAQTYSIQGGNYTVSPNTTSIYTVIGRDAFGCSNVASGTLTVWPIPNISINDVTICIGETFTMNPTGAFTYTYAGGGPVVSPTITSNYYIIGTDLHGCVTPNAKLVSVVVHTLFPSITVNSGTICLGNTFIITPNGANVYTYSSVFNSVTPTVSSVYLVTGKLFSSACTATATSTVIVQPGPSINVNIQPPSICFGESATITPSGALSYTWNSLFSTNALVVTPNVTTSYTITGSDGFGCKTSTVVTAIVNQCLGFVDEPLIENNLTLWPNPNLGLLNISSKEAIKASVFNSLGIDVLNIELNEGNNFIDLKHLEAGMYFVQQHSRKNNQKLKFVKQ